MTQFTKDELQLLYELLYEAVDYDSDFVLSFQEKLKPIKAKIEKILDIDPVKVEAERDDVI